MAANLPVDAEPAPRSLFRRLAQPFLLVTFARAGVQGLSLLTMILAIAAVDLETFGSYSLAWVATTVASGLMYTGLYEYLMRTPDIERDRDTVFWVLLVQGVILVAALAGLAALETALGNALLGRMMLMLSPMPLLIAPTVWCDGLLAREQKLPTVHMVLFVAEVAALIVLALLLWAKVGYLALIIARMVPPFVALAGVAWFTRRLPKPRFDWARARIATRAAWPLQGNSLIGALSNYSADFLLASFLSPAAAGAYRAASRIAMSSTELLFQPLRPVNWSEFARLERHQDRAGMASAYLGNLQFLAAIAMPVLCTFALLGTRIVAAFLQPEWIIAGSIVSVLALARAFGVLDFFMEAILICTGQARRCFTIRTGSSVVVLLGVLALARFGPVVIASWQLLASGIAALVATILIGRTLHVRTAQVLRALAYPAAITATCAGVTEAVARTAPWSPRTSIVAAIAASMLCLGAATLVALRAKRLRLPRV